MQAQKVTFPAAPATILHVGLAARTLTQPVDQVTVIEWRAGSTGKRKHARDAIVSQLEFASAARTLKDSQPNL